MKVTKLKIFSSILALSLVVSLAACGEKPEKDVGNADADSKSVTDTASKTDTGKPAWKTDAITIISNGPVMPDSNDTLTWMEGELGFKLNFLMLPDDDMKTKLNLLSSSNEIPDICVIPSYMGDVYNNFVKQKKLCDLDPLLNEYGSNVKKYRTQEQIDALREEDGTLYAVNNIASTVYDMMLIRQDWLDKYDLSAPATLEEFENVCDKFINGDPDGNGKKDTRGYTVIGLYGLNPIFQAFGANPFGWIEKDGKIVQGATQPEVLEAVKYINSLIKKGYIDKDYLTVTYEKQQELVSTNQTGFCYSELWFASDDYTVYKTTPETNWVGILPPKGADGKFGYTTSSNPDLREYTCISADSKDPAAAMAFMNFIADKDNYYRLRCGEEGKHYELVDGVTKNLGNYATDTTLMTTEGIGFTYTKPFMLEDPPAIAVVPKCADALKLRRSIEADSYSAWYWPVENPMQIAAGWDGEFMEKMNNLMINGGDFDAEWATMVDTAYNKYKLGGLEDIITQEYQKKNG